MGKSYQRMHWFGICPLSKIGYELRAIKMIFLELNRPRMVIGLKWLLTDTGSGKTAYLIVLISYLLKDLHNFHEV